MTVYDSIAQSIAVMEGYGQPGTIATRNHNPGNLRLTGQPSASGYTLFASDDAGWAALNSEVLAKFRKYPDFTLLQFFQRYAPSSDSNDPYNYASFVLGRLNADTGRYFTMASTLSSIAAGVDAGSVNPAAAPPDLSISAEGDRISPDLSMGAGAATGLFDGSITIGSVEIPAPVLALGALLVFTSMGGRRR